MKRLSCVLLAVILSLTCVLTGCGKKDQDGLSITVSHQPYSHGLPSYIADVNGVFEENGLDVEILWFSGGNTQNEALGADEWEAGAYGSAPAIAAGIAYNARIIGINVEDSVSIDYFVRPDSEIAKIKGQVEGHPDIYGNADTWRGKTILCATSTSVHFGLVATLSKLGLTQADVNIVHMDVPSAYAAFKAGEGDVVALWDPQSYQAEEEGWIKVSSGEAAGEEFPTVFIASEKAIEENWDGVYAWFKSYMSVCDQYINDNDGQAKHLLDMQLDNGINTTEELALRFVKDRTLPSLEKNIEYFSGEAGSRKMDLVMENVVDFFVEQGSYTAADKEKLFSGNFIDGQFIEALAKEKNLSMN